MSADGAAMRHVGLLTDGSRCLIRVPPDWNRTLLLYSHGPPTPPDGAAWPEALPLVAALLERGYAIAGCGTDLFYPMEHNLTNQMEVLDLFEHVVGRPTHTIAWGESIGGLMTAALVQTFPERLSGALSLCGPLAGAIPHWNQDLDCSFVLKTLLAPDSELELVNISRPPANLNTALSLLRAAQRTPYGRARISLAAAVRQVPGWTDPLAPEPDEANVVAREEAQYRWLEGIVLLVALSARRVLEDRSGGNASWNTDVNYAEMLKQSTQYSAVIAMYRDAGLSLQADLDALAAAPRLAADQGAVEYFTRYIAFNGDLHDTPLLTLHTLGDGLVPVEHEHAYADVVGWAGRQDLLRQLYVRRAGHCSYTPAEVLVALTALEARIDRGRWPDLAVDSLNVATEVLGPELRALSPAMVVDLDRTGQVVAPAFVEFHPGPFSRPFDTRSVP